MQVNSVCVVQVGDRIVSINSRSVDGLSHADVVAMLKNSYGNISLQVTLPPSRHVTSAGTTQSDTQLLHISTSFTYLC